METQWFQAGETRSWWEDWDGVSEAGGKTGWFSGLKQNEENISRKWGVQPNKKFPIG